MRITLGDGCLLALAAILLGCSPLTRDAPASAPPSLAATSGAPALPATSAASAPPRPIAAPASAAPESVEERNVSKSAGLAGGVTILWPRIIPRDIVDENRDLGAALQQQMRVIVEKHLPGRAIDFRPEPERVCPRTGCAGVSVGLLLSRQGQGCLVLALVSRPGVAPTRIVPWVGQVQLRADTVSFREWPESQITVADYVPCASLLTTMDAQEGAIADALRAAAQ